MTIPDESVWLRVEEIAAELNGLNPAEAGLRKDALRLQGESASVLSLVQSWLELPPPATLLGPGDVVGGRYTLRSKLGEGGMGTVWRATQQIIARDVAVKIIQPTLVTPALCERFSREMEILGQLEHPGIVRIFDAGLHESEGVTIPFFAMECVQGVPLSHWAAACRLDRQALLRVMSDVCGAVQHAHDRRIVHRDLKPSNIMVRPNGLPVVLDFGIARVAGGGAAEAAGLFSGTPHYAAPEQHLGRDNDFRSGESVDVYAAGAILFEVLSGRRLFEFPRGTSISEMRRRIVEGAVPRLSEVLADCPSALDEIAARAVRRDPADRYFSVSLLARALTRASHRLYGPPQPPAPPWTPSNGALVPETQWRLEEKLGEGSTGQVWLAKHEALPEQRVFKFCDSEEKVRTLKRELSLFRLLKERVGKNPHFITLHEVALEEPPWYLMMEHLEAQDLATWCARQPGGLEAMPLELKLELIAQVAEALQCAHEAGILHRDIKPNNLLVQSAIARCGERAAGVAGATTSPPHVFIADFGIGQIIADELLREGAVAGFTFTLAEVRRTTLSGTMLYLAPEILEGNPASARSDIYSLGVVLWQLLVGNFHAALDPAHWPARIADPLLRQDLDRCLAGASERRWPSAGDFATSLRTLPARRQALARRQAEIAARERAAYRRGVIRAAAVAAVVLAMVGVLAVIAWVQRRGAQSAEARAALDQAANILQLSHKAGRRDEGLALLERAAGLPEVRVRLRSLAAGFLSLTDLEEQVPPAGTASLALAPKEGETARALNTARDQIAVGRAVNDTQGAVDFLDAATSQVRVTFTRAEFPWIPIPESGLVQFSPRGRLLGIAGPRTSLQILFCEVKTAKLYSYLFTKGGLKCFTWHPDGRLLASGGEDRTVYLWDLASAREPSFPQNGSQDATLPPKLSNPAIDLPLAELPDWQGSLCALAFHPDGTWLAGLDDTGRLRIWTGFSDRGLPGLPAVEAADDPLARHALQKPSLLLEAELGLSGREGRLEFANGNLIVRLPQDPPRAFALHSGPIFRERWLAPNLRKLAWSTDGRTLCAINDTSIYWMSTDTLALTSTAQGSNPGGVAYDAGSQKWAVPEGDRFILRWPAASPEKQAGSTPAEERWQLAGAEKNRTSRLGISAAGNRLAIYYGGRLQFAHAGVPEKETVSAVAGSWPGPFRELLWDPQGKLASVVYSTAEGFHAESYATNTDHTELAGAINTKAFRLVDGADGLHLVERTGAAGITMINVKTGSRRQLDATPAARQNAPLAVSPDRKWLASVIDRHVIRLIDLASGRPYAELPAPNSAAITFLAWNAQSDGLAGFTEDGFVQTWALLPWQAWLKNHGLAD